MVSNLPEGAIIDDNNVIVRDSSGTVLGFIHNSKFQAVNLEKKARGRQKIERNVLSERLIRGNDHIRLVQKTQVMHPTKGEYTEVSIRRLRQETTEDGIPLPAELYLKADGTPGATIDVKGEVFGFMSGGDTFDSMDSFQEYMGALQSVRDS